ncbi:MAG TPA: hypothetical protein PKA58_24705 [Polyangium sp.]|jgi:ABC-type xylose transport system permease subunit|nr:hypothetical protein [Polyangium sp.]
MNSRVPFTSKTNLAWLTLISTLTIVMLNPGFAWACPSCANLQDANRQAFVNSTVFLSLMPVGMIAVIVIWVWRKMRQAETPR